MRFASPLALLALLIIPVLLYGALGRWQRACIRFPSITHPLEAGRSLRRRLFHLPLLLRVLALVLLVVALARPQAGREKMYEVSKGVAAEIVVDRSSSMGEEMDFDGKRLNRLQVVKRVFDEFVNGNKKELAGRPNDLIGLVTFARYADTVCPLTLAHGALTGFQDTVRLVSRRQEDGTAIGDALMLAAARLRTAEDALALPDGERRRTGPGVRDEEQAKQYEIKSKIIVLLTDGANNAGRRTPEQAAKQAAAWGIKIYAVGVGGDDGTRTIRTLFGTQKVRTGRGVDTKMLQSLADTTGGLFRMADDGEALRAIYREIDQLEKSEVESVRYMDYKEYFARFALIALILLALEAVLRCTVFRKIP